MTNALDRILNGFKFPGAGSASWSVGALGDAKLTEEQAQENSAVFMVIDTIATAFPEPPIMVVDEDTEGEESEIVGHDLTRLLRRPNPALDEFSHSYITELYLQTSGNSYWLKRRGSLGTVVELWPVSELFITPKFPRDGSEWISHYEYAPTVGGRKIDLPVSEVVHFRIGVNKDNNRLGRAPLWYVLAEAFGDEEATKFTAQLLKNWGIPPIVIQSTGNPPQSEVNRIKAEFAERYSGRSRGNVGFLTGGMTAQVIGGKPSDLDMAFAHRLPEERISGVYGVPAIVAGLGAGLDRGTYANFKEAREMFTERKLMSLWRMRSAQIENQLLSDFSSKETEHVRYDLTRVKAMQEDENAKWTRASTPALSGLITRSQFLREIGKVPADDGSDDVYIMPLNLIEVPVGQATDQAAAPGDQAKGYALRAESKARGSGAARVHQALQRAIAKAERGATSRVSKAFEAVAEIVTSKVKAITVDDLWSAEADKVIRDAVNGVFLAQSQLAWEIVSEAFQIEGSFNVNHPQVVEYLAESSKRVVNINEATRKALQKLLSDNVDTERDELRRLIRRTVSESYAGRSAAIARTELRTATNQTAVARYQDAGVTMVDVVDGDEDELCSERNGKRVPLTQFLDWEASEHPNGTISAIPVLE